VRQINQTSEPIRPSPYGSPNAKILRIGLWAGVGISVFICFTVTVRVQIRLESVRQYFFSTATLHGASHPSRIKQALRNVAARVAIRRVLASLNPKEFSQILAGYGPSNAWGQNILPRLIRWFSKFPFRSALIKTRDLCSEDVLPPANVDRR
jgi:hypothetical protein